MQPKTNQNRWLWLLLGGGAIFLFSAIVCVFGAILWQNAQAAKPDTPVEAAVLLPTEAIAPVLPTETIEPSPTVTLVAATASATPAPKPVSGDQLLLPSATLTPRPTATPAPSPTATPNPGQSEGLGVGNIAPDFTVGNTRDSRISLSDLRGKVVVLNFWATWCPPCRSEVPALQAVHNEFDPQGVVVLAVNVKEKVETVSRYAWDNGISFNVWLDEDGWVSTIYGVRSIPITYFIDAQGVIRAVHFGAMNREQITAQLQKML